jgi:hypothetical protein
MPVDRGEDAAGWAHCITAGEMAIILPQCSESLEKAGCGPEGGIVL